MLQALVPYCVAIVDEPGEQVQQLAQQKAVELLALGECVERLPNARACDAVAGVASLRCSSERKELKNASHSSRTSSASTGVWSTAARRSLRSVSSSGG